MITIVGAGSVGLSLGGRLARSGADVCFLTRRTEAAEAIAQHGVRVSDPATSETFAAPANAVTSPDDLPSPARSGPFIVCTRTTDTEYVAALLARACPGGWVIGAQNDVDNEAAYAKHGLRTSGLVVRQTCTVQSPGEVFALGHGRLILGDHPRGFGDACASLASRFESAGFDVGRSRHIGRDKWLKLCVNLMSTPNALVRREDHATEAFVEGKARLLEEAALALETAGIRAESCDGRDRSLGDEIAYQRAALGAGTSARPLPLYNAVWRALREPGLGLEADRFHARIIELAEPAGIATPINRRARTLLEAAVSSGEGPESIAAEDLLS